MSAEQFRVEEVAPSYWRVTFANGPLNLLDPDTVDQLAALEGHPDGALTRDEILDNLTLYWVTNTGTSAARLYWENARVPYKGEVTVPTAFTVFPGELYRAPRSWVEKTYKNLIYFNEVDNGGHFAAWEQPQLLAEEIRAAFRSLRQEEMVSDVLP